MSKSTSGAQKRVAAGLLAGALAVLGLVLTATPVPGINPNTTRPGITDARVTTDAGLQDRFDGGDVVTLTFNEAMNASTATRGTFVLRGWSGPPRRGQTPSGRTDAELYTFNLSCAAGGTATCVLGDGGTPATQNDTLVITVTAAIADTNVAGDGLLEMPATITTTNAAVAIWLATS